MTATKDAPVPNATARQWAALSFALAAAVMTLLDQYAVNLAVPTIQRDFDTDIATLQLVVAAYGLAFSVLLVAGGRIGDQRGRKRTFLSGLAIFTVASVTCAAAPTPLVLILARFVQGAGAALMLPQSLALAQVQFPVHQRRLALSLYAIGTGIGSLLGILVGGSLIEADALGLGWRVTFLINVPIAIIAGIGTILLMDESRAPTSKRIDVKGVLLLTAALLLLLVPLVEGRVLGWPLWLQIALALSFPTFALFAVHERRFNASGGVPLVRLDLLRQRGFAAGTAFALLFFVTVASMTWIIVLTLQIGLGFSTWETALAFVPLIIAFMVSSLVASQLATQPSRGVVGIGTACTTVGYFLFVVVLDRGGVDLRVVDLAPVLFLIGAGNGLVVTPVLNVMLRDVPAADAGVGGGIFGTVQQIGLAFGVVLIGIIFYATTAHVSPGIAATSAMRQREAWAATVPDGELDAQVVQFERCADDRARSCTPARIPDSCEEPVALVDGADLVVEARLDDARAETYIDAARVSFASLGLVLIACLAMVRLLPKQARATPVVAPVGTA